MNSKKNKMTPAVLDEIRQRQVDSSHVEAARTQQSREGGRPSVHRRTVLKGAGGVALSLPFLEGLQPRSAQAAEPEVPPYAIFFRQANGVGAEQSTDEIGTEPERFWPNAFGELTESTMNGRALDELVDYREKLLAVGNVNMVDFDYADGHARGALQCLTGHKPFIEGVGGDSEANGESVDHRIGRELNLMGQDSLYLYAGQGGGWLGGSCVSHRGPNARRASIDDPKEAYMLMVGGTDGLTNEAIAQITERNRSVNDLVRGQLRTLLKSPKLSSSDQRRLDLHLTSIRDLESSLSCRMEESELMALNGLGDIYESNDGNEVLETARMHMSVAALAVACGFTRSVALQIGNGNDGSTRYWDPDSGTQMENYHYVSHRRSSHGSDGDIIANSDLMHHKVDRQFAQTFRHLLDRLSEYNFGTYNLLDCGVAVWHNDLGSGPGHSRRNVPFILAGGAGGYFKQGQYLNLDSGDNVANHARLLNSIATAVGCKSAGKDYCDDIGDSGSNRTPHSALQA